MTSEIDISLMGEPKTRIDAVASVLGAIAAGAGVVMFCGSLVGFIYLDKWWYFLLIFGLVVGGLLALRFTRDDRDVAGQFVTLNLENAELESDLKLADADIVRLLLRLKETNRVVMVEDKRFVPADVPDAAWDDANRLVMMAADFGYLPGRDTSGMSQRQQERAVAVLLRVCNKKGWIERVGKRYQLAASQRDVLELLASFNHASTETVLRSSNSSVEG